MRIIGIDPGLNRTGFGIVDYENQTVKLQKYGCISPKSDLEFQNKIIFICEELKYIIKNNHPEIAVVEDIFYAVNPRSALKLGHVRGAILVTVANIGLRFEELTPLEVKKGITGYGRADKDQVGEMVKVILGLKSVPIPDDSSDALAVAIAYAFKSDFITKINSVEGG